MLQRQSAGRLGSPAGPAARSPLPSSSGWFLDQRSLEPQLPAQSLSVDSLAYFDPVVWLTSSTLNDAFPCDFLAVNFLISEIMCQTHAFAVSLLGVYLSEKFTHSLMSQSLRASAALWCVSCCFVLPFEVMESSWTMITQRSCQSMGNTARGILFMKERFTSIPLESLCSRCASANWCYFAASGELSGFRYSAALKM